MLNPESSPSHSLQIKSKSLAPNELQTPRNTIFIQSRKASNAQSLPGKIQNIKLSQVLPQKELPQKVSLPIKEFEYSEVNSKIKSRTFSEFRSKSSFQLKIINQNFKLDRIPIKIIQDKIRLEQNTKIQLKRGATQRNIRIDKDSQPNSESNPQSESEQNQQQFLWGSSTSQKFAKTAARQSYEERVKAYNPKLSIFERFNYENYENYQYKNPFKKHKYESVIKDYKGSHRYEFPKNSKYQHDKGSAKNLEIVFCEIKYPDFVKKTNQILEKQQKSPTVNKKNLELSSKNLSWNFQTKSNCTEQTSLKLLKKNIIEELGINSRDLLNSKNTTRWAYSPQRIKSSVKSSSQQRAKNIQVIQKNLSSKSTLQRYLQEFKILQKLTLLNEKEQQNSTRKKKQSPQIFEDFSKTVLINLLINKFPFLQNLNRSFRNHLLKTLFDLDSIQDSTKISIHEYLKFNRIFISKDSTSEEVGKFIFQLLFKTSPLLTFEAGKKILIHLNPKHKHKLDSCIQKLFQILNEQYQQTPQQIMQKFLSNTYWVFSVIELIKQQ